MEIRIEVDAARLREGLRRAPQAIHGHVDSALSRAALEISRDARRRAPKAFSTLTNSIHSARVGDLHYQVAPGVNYAPWVEGGRKAGKMPGVANGLREWVKQKVSIVEKAPPEGKKKRKKRKEADADNLLDRMTFVIARAIGKRGIQAQPFMAPAMESAEARLRDLVNAAVERGLQEVLR